MKTISNKFHEKILSLAVFMFLFAFTASAQDFDAPPEFGLDDDPAPGAPIDLYIPIMMLVMFIVLFVYFYKNRVKNTF